MAFLDQGLQTAPRIVGTVNPKQVHFAFTTDGSGVPTLVYSYDGSLPAPVQATNVYTCTIGSYKQLLSAQISNSIGATVNIAVTDNPTTGVVTLTASATLASARVDVCFTLDQTV